MLPFHVDLKPGGPIYLQVVYAATKAIVAGQLRPGDEFPSVRSLSKHLKINPNTAHKVITCLAETGLLEIRPGSVAVIAALSSSTQSEKTKLLQNDFEGLVVEAKRLGIELRDLQAAMEKHWQRLSVKGKETRPLRGSNE